MHNKSTNNEKEDAIVKQLRAEGTPVYSISRINTFNTCEYEYFKTYVRRNRGISNCYSEIGTFIHDYIESVYRDEISETSDFTRKLNTKLMELELLDLDFASESIKNSFTKDMSHFTNNFNKLDGAFILEKQFVVNLEGHWFTGYIDAIRETENETHIIDWKTSSKFAGSKIIDAGRQLAIYKLALESVSEMQIDKVMWDMLKYVYVCHVQKNKSIKRRIVNRGKLISDMAKAFEKDLLSAGFDELDVFIAMEKALETNSMDELPDVIKDKYWIEECLLPYEVTDEVVDELKSYIKQSINGIESKDIHDEDDWQPLNLDKESFYCNTLCNHRESCQFIKEHNKEQKFK